MFVGDTVWDVQACVKAGVECIAEQLADIASRGAKLSRRAGTETGAGAAGDR